MQSQRIVLLKVEFTHNPMAFAAHSRALETDHLQALTTHWTVRAVVLHLGFRYLHLFGLAAKVFH